MLYNILWHISRLPLPWSKVKKDFSIPEAGATLIYLLMIILLPVSTRPNREQTVCECLLLLVVLLCHLPIFSHGIDQIKFKKTFSTGWVGWTVSLPWKVSFYDGYTPIPCLHLLNRWWSRMGFTHFCSGYVARHIKSASRNNLQKIRGYLTITAKAGCSPWMFEHKVQLVNDSVAGILNAHLEDRLPEVVRALYNIVPNDPYVRVTISEISIE